MKPDDLYVYSGGDAGCSPVTRGRLDYFNIQLPYIVLGIRKLDA
jgi:hypothetical protein